MRKSSFFHLLTLGISLSCFVFSACTPKKIASDVTSKIIMGGYPSIEREADIEIAENTGMTMLQLIEALHYDNPKNKKYKLVLARSYGNYAFGFFENQLLEHEGVNEEKYNLYLERTKRFYKKGKDIGLDLLSQKSSRFKSALNKDVNTFKKSLKSFGKSDVPALFWAAFNWGSHVNFNKNSPEALIAFPKVEAMMERVLALDPTFFYGGPHLFFGVSYGSRPKMFGGNLDKSKQHFEKARKAYNGKFLMSSVLYAQYYAVQAQDPALFESLLQQVIHTDPATLPAQRLANELAIERAKLLLAKKKDYFDLKKK